MESKNRTRLWIVMAILAAGAAAFLIGVLIPQFRAEKALASIPGVSFTRQARIIEGAILAGTEVRDEDLRHLKHLRWLKAVRLDNTEITDKGLKDHIAELQRLRYLNLAGVRTITDSGVSYCVKRLRRLDYLPLGNTRITDESIREIATLPRLRYLDVGKTAITDASLDLLAKTDSLEELIVVGTNVTRRGVRQFAQKRPAVRLESDF